MLNRKPVISILMIFCIVLGCSKPNIRDLTNCRSVLNTTNLVDISLPETKSKFLFVALQDRQQVDAGEQWLNTGYIGLMKRHNYEIVNLKIEDRDAYPFRPLGIDSIQINNDIYLFVVNQAFKDQRSIEFFEFKYNRYQNNYNGASLRFLKRIRTRNLGRIVDVAAFSTDEYMLIREKSSGFFGNVGSLIFHSNRILNYWPNKLGKTSNIVSGGERILYVANGSELFQINVDTKSVIEKKVKSGLQVNALAVDNDELWLGSKFEGKWVISNSNNSYYSPVNEIELLLALRPEAKLLIGQSEFGLSECDLPK